MLSLPPDLDSVSSEWLSQALATPVTSFQILDAHAGTTGRALLALDYAQASDLPQRLFLKLPPADKKQRAFVVSSGMGQREALFYQHLSAEVPVRVPRCFFSASDETGEHYAMLLENLGDSDCSFHNASKRYSLEYMRQVLSAFARLHAYFWNSSRFTDDLAWVQPPLQHAIALPLIAQALEKYAQTMPPVFTAMAELYLAEADAVHRLWNRGVATLIHGDVHDGNLFYDNGEPGLLDWALVSRGPGMRDVGYFMAGTLTPLDQREAAHELIAHYRAQLLAHGAPAPSDQELWQQYQWHAAYVWVGATVTLAMGAAWQPVNYVKASLKRLHATLDDLDTVNAIRAAL